jgi:hypothetical protein
LTWLSGAGDERRVTGSGLRLQGVLARTFGAAHRRHSRLAVRHSEAGGSFFESHRSIL